MMPASSARNKNKTLGNSSESPGKNYQTHFTECEIEDGTFMIEHRSISHSIRMECSAGTPASIPRQCGAIERLHSNSRHLRRRWRLFMASHSPLLRLPLQSKLKTKTITVCSHDERNADREKWMWTNWMAHKDGWKCQSWYRPRFALRGISRDIKHLSVPLSTVSAAI